MTDPTRRPPSPEEELRTISRLALALADQWPTYRETESLLAAPVIGASGQGDRRSSSVPDPTGGVFASYERYGETKAEVHEALGHVRAVQRRMDAVRKQHPDSLQVDAAIRAARCDGSVDPTCTNNAVRSGICWTCIKRQQRAEKASAS